MPDILHDLTILSDSDRVFDAISTPLGLDSWWTLDAAGTPAPGARYQFGFGPNYAWEGVVRIYEPGLAIAWEMTRADADWLGTVVGFTLIPGSGDTRVAFYHRNWREANAHFRTSSYCWGLYLRLLRRYVEDGEIVPYGQRNDV
ncbi:MAG: SRPBCC domain-containing protein [Rhodothermales bacterium]